MYDVYAMDRDYYGYPYNFSSLLKASGLLYGLMLRMTGGVFDVPRDRQAATPARSDFSGPGSGAYILGPGAAQVAIMYMT